MEARPNILLVDDVAMFRELGSLFLARSGRVTTASCGEECIAAARRNPPDLILVDLFMPDLNGDRVCEILKDDPDLCEIPVVVITGSDEPKDWGRAIRAGANDVLTKPLSRAELIATVNRMLHPDGSRGMPRVPLAAPTELRQGQDTHGGTLRNISRGGIFVETHYRAPEHTEVGLRFALPESELEFRPVAEVLWHRDEPEGASLPTGMGMRFVEIDGGAVRQLDEFVSEWFGEGATATPENTGGIE